MKLNEYFKTFYPPDWETAEYNWTSMLGGMREYPDRKAATIFPRVVCADGVSLSVQGHWGAYSRPRDDFAESYSHVEVGCIEDASGKSMPPPETWREWSGGDFPSSVYGYVPVDVVEAFINAHGGKKP